MIGWIMVAAGGALGALSRYWLGRWVNLWWQRDLPLGTLLINVIGSVALGMVIGMKNKLPVLVVQGLGAGYLGSFTTYSTLNYEMLSLIKQKKHKTAVIYILVSFIMGLIGGYAGFILAMNY